MRKHQAECVTDGSIYVHGEQRRNFRSKPLHVSTAFTLLPTRPGSYRDTRIPTRGSELLGLQVQGFCCPLQQRPSSGRVTHRVTPQSRGGGDETLRLLTRAKGRLESRAEPDSRSRTRSRPGTTPRGSAVSETTGTPPTHFEERARHGRPSAAKVNSALHLYLPSSLCEDEEQDAETEEMRSSAKEPHFRESEVTFNQSVETSGNQTNPGPCTPQHTKGTF
ncbi:uncharacterized protein LOC122970141 [Scomber scombrus]|uniref:Uncharacterized protein LOC122970141 n=1 Tax=Scomber scombrus TaxID=13677 RepID=A0AAV1NKH8_SCOSC